MKIRISEKYVPKMIRFESYPKFISTPHFNCILKNLETGQEDIQGNRFKFDTGADISIINGKYDDFVKNMNPIDYLKIQYGGNIALKRCPIYKVGIIIKGYEIETVVLHDSECPFLLLGHHQFIEYNTYNLLDSSLNKIKIFRG